MAFERIVGPNHATNFIVEFLRGVGRPASSAEIRTAVRQAEIPIKDSSLNWTLTNLNSAGRIRRVSRGVYEATDPGLPSELANGTELESWLAGWPVDVAQCFAVRMALRVLPLMARDAAKSPARQQNRALLAIFRAGAVAWAACRYPDNNLADAASAAETDLREWTFTTDPVEALVHAVRAVAVDATGPSAAGLIGGYANRESAAVRTDLWAAINEDKRWLERHSSREPRRAVSSALAVTPLWSEDVRLAGSDATEQLRFLDAFPPWVNAELDELKNELSPDDFEVWFRWYDARLRGAEVGGFGHVLDEMAAAVAELLDLRVARQPDEFWRQSPSTINETILRWTDEMVREPMERPTEPAPGPGPQYRIADGKLSEQISSPEAAEAEQQSGLHRRLRDNARILAEALHRAANRFPELANTAHEYSGLMGVETSDVDVVGVWAVGGALASFAQSYRDQNVSRTLADPLEPQLEALLQSVVRQHGAFILAFDEGRELVQRADEFALDATRLEEIAGPGTALLGELTENARLVDDRTRKLHKPIHDSVIAFGWGMSRVSYSAYAIVRNATRAMIKFAMGDDPNLGVIVSILGGGSVLAGDPNAEFVRAAVPVLQTYGSQLLSFFSHSPEMRAYVEWALHILKEDEQSKRR